MDHLHKALNTRKEGGILRSLPVDSEGVDFYSNDYLGLARNKELQKILLQQVVENPALLSGSTGSRLISGNSSEAVETERYIATQHKYPSALLFPSGYNANLALFSTITGRHDIIIVDELVHRSVHDACRMSNARKLKFRHNDLNDLEQKLKKQKEGCYISIESLYSMEGDFAPIQEIAELARQYNAHLIVDEAHAFGVFGYGLVSEYQLQEKVLATVVTYGKALGAHGATILSNESVISYLINFASPFIYTTSAQDIQWKAIRSGYHFLDSHPELSQQLQKNIDVFRKYYSQNFSSEKSPVQTILIPDHSKLRTLQKVLCENGFLTYAVYSPTVKSGTERLRICLHAFNTEEEIKKLTRIINQFTSL
ncbi:pyridoxal phosphate-dependent aminotransferase family protein [Chryseobacterium sp.]|uniref:aminotransferase class I/II-fold pyridoxal phosphate-dependent enzyme n=1 Tax=Chryseobacterium sp. TaxID=1871047 RepID=UPI0025BEA891|nr:pyridoxal phosphate-dependent aminotransferase family protein [Chryseobacterium sp.]